MEGTLAWPLEHSARPHGDRPAIIDGDRSLTYRELHERVERLGTGFDRQGVAPGASVGVLLGNVLEHVEVWHGVPAHGRVLVTLNTRLATPELAFMIDDSGVRLLVVDAANLAAGRSLRHTCPGLETLVYVGCECPTDCVPYSALLPAERAPTPDLAPDTVATILYTGGTTGRPKGVVLSHANVLANTKHMLYVDAYAPGDRYLHAGPLFHTGSAQMVYPTTWSGGTHVMLPQFTPAGFAALVEQHRATVTVLVPTMIQMVLDHVDDHPADLTSLRLVHYGASPMSPSLLERAMDVIGCDFAQGFGMTEAGPAVTWLTAEDHRLARHGHHPERLASAGHAIPGVQMEIRDTHGAAVPDGTVGEVWVRGPNVMLGYHHRPEETERALTGNGWLRTGDAGYTDREGYLFLVDRLKDMIISGGENVYSIEVEHAVSSHEAVGEVAVIGLPDLTWGERVHAIVVPRPGCTVEPEEIVEHVRGRIAGYKIPKSVEVRDEPLPKSGPGKILKRRLRDAYLPSG